MAQIFISYSRNDTTFAKRLAESLSHSGFQVWIDLAGISAGSKWSQAIQEALDETSVMIVIISPESMASSNVTDEWQYYLDQMKPIIPVLLKPAKYHFQLNRIQYIDFQKNNFDSALDQLIKEIRLKLNLPVTVENRSRINSIQSKIPLSNKRFKNFVFMGGIMVLTLVSIVVLYQRNTITQEQSISTQISTDLYSTATLITSLPQTSTISQIMSGGGQSPNNDPALSLESIVTTVSSENLATEVFTVRIRSDYANLRSGPGANFPSMATAIRDERYAPLGQAQGVGTNGQTVTWYLITYWNHQPLWVSSEAVEAVPPELDNERSNATPRPTPRPPPTMAAGGCTDNC